MQINANLLSYFLHFNYKDKDICLFLHTHTHTTICEKYVYKKSKMRTQKIFYEFCHLWSVINLHKIYIHSNVSFFFLQAFLCELLLCYNNCFTMMRSLRGLQGLVLLVLPEKHMFSGFLTITLQGMTTVLFRQPLAISDWFWLNGIL